MAKEKSHLDEPLDPDKNTDPDNQDPPQPDHDTDPETDPDPEPEDDPDKKELEEGDPDPDPDPEPEPKPKKRSGFQRRLDRERRKTEAAEAEVAELREKLNSREKPEGETDEPNPDDYENGSTDIKFIRDLAKYEGKRSFAEAQAEYEIASRQKRAKEAADNARDNYNSKIDEAIDKHEDMEDLLNESDIEFTDPNVQHAIMTSEHAGELAYHLLKNPQDAAKIAKMEPITAIRVLGKIEGALNIKPAPKPKKKSSMTDPITPVSSSASKSAAEFFDDMSDKDFNDNFKFSDIE